MKPDTCWYCGNSVLVKDARGYRCKFCRATSDELPGVSRTPTAEKERDFDTGKMKWKPGTGALAKEVRAGSKRTKK